MTKELIDQILEDIGLEKINVESDEVRRETSAGKTE